MWDLQYRNVTQVYTSGGNVNLLPIDQSDKRTELEKYAKEEFEKALENLVKGVTPRDDFPNGKLPKRPVRGGGNFDLDFVPGWWFVKQANLVFQHRWSFDVEQVEIGSNFVWVRGKVTVKVPSQEITENGVTVKTEGYDIVKSQFGGAAIKKKRNSNEIIDIGDDLKAAATDSMKKCLTLFGFAADVYGPREAKEQGAADSKQLDALYSWAEKAGISRQDVQALSEKEFEHKPEEISEKEVLELINIVRKRAKKVVDSK